MKLLRYQKHSIDEMSEGRIKVCPKCGSADTVLYMGSLTGMRYRCKNCGYIGVLFPEVSLEEIEKMESKMKKEFYILDDLDVSDKTVLIRVDVNTPYDEKKKRIIDSERIKEHAKSIRELIDKKAKVVVLAHQGRKGNPDFIHLDQHAELLSKHAGKKIKFINDIIGKKAREAIKSLKEGEAILLDNVRFLKDETEKKSIEEHSNSRIVKALSPLADYFILDGFSVAHRAHASVIGFSEVLPSAAGRVMEKEVNSLSEALTLRGVTIFILGGAKPDDCLAIMENLLKKKLNIKFLIGGLLAQVFLLTKGFKIGDESESFLKKKGYLNLIRKAKKLMQNHSRKIILPDDLAYELRGKRKEILVKDLPVDGLIMDIGKNTIKKYKKLIKKAKCIVFKGTLGVYEKPEFIQGTENILKAITKTKAFSLIGGGDTGEAVDKLKIPRKKFSYVSLAGGAFISFLSGEKLPGIEALKASYNKFKNISRASQPQKLH